MSVIADIAITVLLILGGGFALIGSWGLVRLPSTMERLHGPTKATTLGLGALLLASVVYFQTRLGIWTAHELLISLFLFSMGFRFISIPFFLLGVYLYWFTSGHRYMRRLVLTWLLFFATLFIPVDIDIGGWHGPPW